MLLLGHLAANSGARRAELASLQLGDLDGDILTIARSTSNEILGCTKSGRIRRMTLGHETAELWRELVGRWQRRDDGERFGPWLFSAAATHQVRLTTSCLGHWFGALAHEAGHPDVTLHRLRHSAATNLVSRGDILHAPRSRHLQPGTHERFRNAEVIWVQVISPFLASAATSRRNASGCGPGTVHVSSRDQDPRKVSGHLNRGQCPSRSPLWWVWWRMVRPGGHRRAAGVARTEVAAKTAPAAISADQWSGKVPAAGV